MQKRNARIGMVLFAVYVLLYGGFVGLVAFAVEKMEATPIAGVNVAILYGFGLIFAALIGFLWLGTVPLTSGLVARVFGPRYLGALFGVVFFSHQIGGFLGAWLGGYLFDLTGSYEQVWLIAVALGVLAAILHWPIADSPIERQARSAENI